MPTGAEIWQALYGAWRFARLDRQALHYFDLTHRGVWRSFWAAAICYPGFLVLLWLRLDHETLARSSLGHIFLVETIGYVIGWCAFPLAALGFCRWLGHENEGFEFITAYNWSQVLQTVFFLLLALVGAMLPATLGADLDLAGYVLMLAYEWFIALVVIGAGGGVAVAIVIIDVVLGSIIVVLASGLY
ncbi:MAG TPA: hypothetical protein VGL83_05995 [Stellaceae bacterium]|jgi:hypothetical protein